MAIGRFTQAVLDALHYFNVSIPTKTLIVTGEVSPEMATNVYKGLQLIDGPNELITVILDSPGGWLYSGMGIYDALRACQGVVKIIGRGEIMSAASMILQAADSVEKGGGRFLCPNTTVMLHLGTDAIPTDHPENIQRSAKESKRAFDAYTKLIADKMGITVKQFRKDHLFDTFLTAGQAVAMGVADGIIEDTFKN